MSRKAINPKKALWGTRTGKTKGGHPKTSQCRIQFVCPQSFRDLIERTGPLVNGTGLSDTIRRLIDLGAEAAEAKARGVG